MSVARISGPQLLDAPLRPAQEPVDVETVGVSADLGRDPGRQPGERLGQGASHPEGPLKRREADLHLLSAHRAPSRPFGSQRNAPTGEGVLEQFGAVGKIPEKPARGSISKLGGVQELFYQYHVRSACSGELVGD